MDDDQLTPRPAQGRPGPLTDSAKAATCPFMRTLLRNQPELYDAEARTMSVATLKRFVREQRPPGAEGSLERVLAFFARVNQTPWRMRLANLLPGRDLFSTNFPGSRGDHPGSTDIYSPVDGEFDPAAFDRVVAHSSDGETMSHRDVARAIIEANGSEVNPGRKLDLANSAGEFALLFNLLATPDSTMRIADMRQLFERNEWPPAALDNLGRPTAGEWLEITRKIAHEIADLEFHGDEHAAEREETMRHVESVVGGPIEQR